MPGPLIGLAAASLAGGALQASAAKKAAGAANDATLAAAQLQTAELQRQFDAMRKLQRPYVQAGRQGMNRLANLYGLNGAQKQNAAIGRIANGAEMKMLMQQGENAILSNASTTGGLRGGNTQEALMEMRPQLLQSLIDKKAAQLGGFTSMGQSAAAGVGQAGMQTGANVANVFGNMGASQAANALARGQATSNMIGGFAGTMGNLMGMEMMNPGMTGLF